MTPKGTALPGVYKKNYVCFALVRTAEEELHEMLERVLDDLARNRDLFLRVEETGGFAELFVGWYSPNNSGDVLSHTLMGKFADLRINLALDVYGAP